MIFQVLGVAVAVWLFLATWQVWVLAFVALIIAAAILPAARVGERWRVPRGLVVLAVYVVAVGVFLSVDAAARAQTAPSCSPDQSPQFTFGFATLKGLLGPTTGHSHISVGLTVS